MSTTKQKSNEINSEVKIPIPDLSPSVQIPGGADLETIKQTTLKETTGNETPIKEPAGQVVKPKANAKPKVKAGSKKIKAPAKPKTPKVKSAKPPKAKVVKDKVVKEKVVGEKLLTSKVADTDNKIDQNNSVGGNTTELADVDKNDDPKKRYFKCVYNEETYGRLCGLKPKQAANKAFTSLLKYMKKSGQIYGGGKINFSIVECTRGSKHNVYCYIGERKPLPNPVEVPIKVINKEGTTIEKKVTYYHKNHVKKVRKADVEK